MKKILFFISILLGLFFTYNVSALTFKEGDFIQGEYITKVHNGEKKYLTVQFIRDNNNNFIYCLEPYVLFSSGTGYNEYKTDLEKYSGLTTEQLRRIELLAYYGYNHPGRMGNKWYAITQYLIWKTVDPSDNIYFTDTLNGNKITKYETEISEIEQDVKNNDLQPSFSKEQLKVNYKEDLILKDKNNILSEYEIIDSDLDYQLKDNELILKNVTKNGQVRLKRKHTIYKDNIYIYTNSTSQNLFKPGNPTEEIINLNIKVVKGNIKLNIYDDDSVYSVEKDFSDTCYGLYNDKNVLIEKVCTDKEFSYETQDLPYGDYYVKQESYGVGYKKDENIYNVTIDENNEHPVVELKNILIRNKIEINKEYCKNNDCYPEKNAEFDVYDINNNLVKTIITDDNGYAFIELGYGSYVLKQIKGMTGYDIVEDFSDRIEDETTLHVHNLKNNWLEKEIALQQPQITPPDTAVKGIFDYIIEILKNIVKLFKSSTFFLKKG